MFDKINLTFYTPHDEYYKENVFANKLELDSNDEVKYTNKKFNGLYVSMVGNKVKVSGSLHKFYYGNNYTFFTKSDIKQAVKKFCELFLIEPNDPTLRFTLLEFAVNIPTDFLPLEYAKRMLMYNNVEFNISKPKNRSAKRYGMICNLTDNDLKFYDKYLQTILCCKGSSEEKQQLRKIFADNNLLRFEIVYKRVNKMPYLRDLTSLYSDDFLDFISNDFIAKYKRIVKNKALNISEMRNNEILLYHAGNSMECWEDLRTKSKVGFREKRKEYNKIVRKYATNDLTDELEEKIKLMLILLKEVPVSYDTNTYCVIGNILTPILQTCNINVNRYNSNNIYSNDLIGV